MAQDGPPTQTPRVTVIIPAFDAQDTLARAARSVLAQTERSLELMIVDDSSRDGTASVAMALAAEDARVVVLCLRQNSGKPVAMNHATQQATGRWIAVVDADDWCAPTRLKHLIDRAEAAGVDMVADNQVLVDGGTHRKNGLAFRPSHGSRTLDLDHYLAGSDPLASFDLGMLKPVFRADFLRRHRVEYHPTARNGHDFYVLLCFFMAGGRALLVDEPLYHYVRPNRAAVRHGLSGGRRYRFDLMRQTNDHYLAQFGARMTPGQRRRLVARGRNLEVLQRLNQAKTQLRGNNVVGLLTLALRSPWPLGLILARWASELVSGGH